MVVRTAGHVWQWYARMPDGVGRGCPAVTERRLAGEAHKWPRGQQDRVVQGAFRLRESAVGFESHGLDQG
jgi:hypothetical protein